MAKAFATLNPAELSVAAVNDPIYYLVDKLIPLGSINMLAGKPKAGKSTMARQLAACIANGEDFLGRSTVRSEVLYFASEEILAHVHQHFEMLGITREEDGIHTVFKQRPGTDFIARLRETLKELPEVRLVILDPLVHFLSGVDLDKYQEVAPAMLGMIELAEELGVAILVVHHTKKRVTEEAGDAVLGSSALMASVSSTIFLSGEMGSKRDVRSTQRYGTRLEYTFLEFSEITGSFSLGEACGDVKDKRMATTKEDRMDKVLIHVRLYEGGISQENLRALVQCSQSDLAQALDAMCTNGLIVRTGEGKKGSPYLYSAPKASGIELVAQAS